MTVSWADDQGDPEVLSPSSQDKYSVQSVDAMHVNDKRINFELFM